MWICFNSPQLYSVEILFYIYNFFDSGYVNATKIANLKHCDSAVNLLHELLNVTKPAHKLRFTVDNLTGSGTFNRTINLSQLKAVNVESNLIIKYNKNIFPGAVCKIRGLCTLIVFASGKYTCVGAKCIKSMEAGHALMNAIICGL